MHFGAVRVIFPPYYLKTDRGNCFMYKLPSNAAERLQEMMEEMISQREECGCQLVIYLEGEKVIDLAAGYTTPERDKKVDTSTLFPIFSVGKAVMSTTLHTLLAAGKAGVDDPVCKYWQEFSACGKDHLTLRHLLSHRAGLHILPQGTTPDELADWDAMCNKLANSPALYDGKKMCYHSITYAWLIGEVVRCITGVPFQEIIRRNVLDQLGISDQFYYGIPESLEYRTASLDSSRDKAEKWCDCFISTPAVRRGFIPSANGFATAGAIAKHYSSLLESSKDQLLPMDWIDAATVPQRDISDPLPPGGTWVNFGLGYALCGDDPACPGVRFGHGGAAGSQGFADKERQMALGFTKNMPLASHPDHPVRTGISEILGIRKITW